MVFVDGCFWHGCPQHGVRPKTNAEWWRWKLAMNAARDADTDARLTALGWKVVRIWEHVGAADAADAVEAVLDALARAQRPASAGESGADATASTSP